MLLWPVFCYVYSGFTQLSKCRVSAASGRWCWTIDTHDDGSGNQIRPSMLLPHRHSGSEPQISVVK